MTLNEDFVEILAREARDCPLVAVVDAAAATVTMDGLTTSVHLLATAEELAEAVPSHH